MSDQDAYETAKKLVDSIDWPEHNASNTDLAYTMAWDLAQSLNRLVINKTNGTILMHVFAHGECTFSALLQADDEYFEPFGAELLQDFCNRLL